MFELDFPMLRHTDFSALSREELIGLSLPAHREFLQHVANNTLSKHLSASLQKWRSDKLPLISREQLATHDISLSLYIRKKVFLNFLPAYSGDIGLALRITDELDRYVLEAETQSFLTYFEIHHQQIRKMNRQLSRRTNQLLEAQQLANLGSFEWDLTGRGQPSFTPQVYNIFELEKPDDHEEFLRHVYPADREKLRATVAGALRGRQEFECEFRFVVKGHTKTIWSRGVVELKNDAPYRLRGTVMDITARQSMLRRLRRNEDLYKQAEKLAHLGNWTYHLRTHHITWSDELYRICNMSPQSKEITLDFFLSLVHPDDRKLINKALKHLLSELQVDYHVRILLPSHEMKFLLGKAQVVKDITGKPYKVIGTCQDITHEVRLNDELRRREEKLARLNKSLEQKNVELQRKNEELTSFNYVASHDLQEPLRKIKTFSDLVLTREKSNLSGTGVAWLERISLAAARLQSLIQDLLAFSRTQLFDDTRKAVDLNEVMKTIASEYESEVAQGKIILNVAALPVITGVPFQVQQLFENLIANSVKYHRENEPARITVSYEIAEVVASPDHPETTYLKISVADQGIGFEQKYASKIFEIFQRLHGQFSYSGTGIGLAICKKIAENHGGFIRAAGVPDEGAVFDVYFPESLLVSEPSVSGE